MIDDLQRDELRAEGHHVELGPDGLVLSQDLRLDDAFLPPARKLEDRNSVILSSRSYGILDIFYVIVVRVDTCVNISFYLSPVFVRDGEDPHDGVAVLLDEVVHVPGEHGLADHGDLQTFSHRRRKVLISIRV